MGVLCGLRAERFPREICRRKCGSVGESGFLIGNDVLIVNGVRFDLSKMELLNHFYLNLKIYDFIIMKILFSDVILEDVCVFAGIL